MLFHHIRNYGCRLNVDYSYKGLKVAVKNKTALRLKPQREIKTDFFAEAFQKDEMVKFVDKDGNIT